MGSLRDGGWPRSDLQENETVAVIGVRQPDGSLKANTITIVPAGQGGPGVLFGPGTT